MNAVDRFEENYTLPSRAEAEKWYEGAIKLISGSPGVWFEVDRTEHFNRSSVHKEKFNILNRNSLHNYAVEYRYPELGVCVMYAYWYPKPDSIAQKVKAWFK